MTQAAPACRRACGIVPMFLVLLTLAVACLLVEQSLTEPPLPSSHTQPQETSRKSFLSSFSGLALSGTFPYAGTTVVEPSSKSKPYTAMPPTGSKTLRAPGHFGQLRRISLRFLGAVLGANMAEGRTEAASVPGFDAWLKFAREGNCSLTAYKRITRDLAPFRERGGITADMLARTRSLPDVAVFTITNGTLSYAVQGSERAKAARYAMIVNQVTKQLPDLKFVLSLLDEPRILPGPIGDDIEATFGSAQCRDASRDFHKYRHLHGVFITADENPIVEFPCRELLPLFTQTKINECYSDITMPSQSNWDALLSHQQREDLLPWWDREATLFFRGSTSGGMWSNASDYTRSHRHRLVYLGKHTRHMDMGFTDYLQCSESCVCQVMKEQYGLANSVSPMDNFLHKFLMVPDGNTHVGRTPQFLSSGSLVFKAGLFSDWYEERLIPYKHYLPVKLDYNDLQAKLDWALQHDKLAADIAARGQAVALSQIRNKDLECYIYRLLLEYASLLVR